LRCGPVGEQRDANVVAALLDAEPQQQVRPLTDGNSEVRWRGIPIVVDVQWQQFLEIGGDGLEHQIGQRGQELAGALIDGREKTDPEPGVKQLRHTRVRLGFIGGGGPRRA
jgi:hypothetical protein